MGIQGEDTGRIRRTLSKPALNALKSDTASHSRLAEFALIAEIDRAHLLMLLETGLIDRPRAASLMRAIADLEAGDFAPILEVEAPRGAYLLYENYLTSRLTEEVAGMLHLGRSRNDLNATMIRLSLRGPLANTIRDLLRLITTLLAKGRRYSGTVMPAFTHFQAALPSSYGHYLIAVAQPLLRSAEDILADFKQIDVCPLGAGAATGTSLPIRPELTARWLGFGKAVHNSLDAVASRDFALRFLSDATIVGATLSRIATDLQLWCTGEFGFLALPDHLVGASSMMPQKRNPYLLEHIQGRSAKPLGALVAATTAMHSKPFSNNISAGTEAVSGLADALAATSSALRLLRLVVGGAIPQAAAMRARTEGAFLEATELANRLVMSGFSFRTAHHLVGRAITDAIETKGPSDYASLLSRIGPAAARVDVSGLEPEVTMRGSVYGGGPGACIGNQGIEMELGLLRSYGESLRSWTGRWAESKRDLRAQAAKLCQG
jgi:argininosuccinate lyase